MIDQRQLGVFLKRTRKQVFFASATVLLLAVTVTILAQTAQTAINTQASNAVQSVSGVNLDEEAANLLQWQQAYQAAAQALTIGNSLFTTLIDSVNGTFT